MRPIRGRAAARATPPPTTPRPGPNRITGTLASLAKRKVAWASSTPAGRTMRAGVARRLHNPYFVYTK